jgi:pheromone shutdown protein TraB
MHFGSNLSETSLPEDSWVISYSSMASNTANEQTDGTAVQLFHETSTVMLKSKNGGSVLLVGSVHAGFDTAAQFAQLAREFDATLIASELGPARYKIMTRSSGGVASILLPSTGNGSFALPSLASVSMLMGQLPAALVMSAVADSEYGDDMVSTIHTAEAMNVPLYLCDRSQAVTLSRVGFEAASLVPRMWWLQLLGGLLTGHRAWLADGVHGMLSDDIGRAEDILPPSIVAADKEITRRVAGVLRTNSASAEDVQALRDAIPLTIAGSLLELKHEQDKSFGRAMISERDVFMAHALYNSPKERTIALVGLGHLEGIQAHWGRTSDAQVHALLGPPPGFYFFNAFVPLATLGAVGYSLVRLQRRSPRLAWGLAGAGAATVGAVGMAAVAVKKYTDEIVGNLRRARAPPTVGASVEGGTLQ